MALRKRGKNGYWHAYFRTVTTTADGTLKYATTTVNLYTSDLLTARAKEAELMLKNRAARMHQRSEAHMIRLEVAAGARPVEALSASPIREHRRKRLRIADWEASAEKYRVVSADSRKILRRFAKWCDKKYRYFDEITPEIALAYLNELYGAPDKGKSFNNNKTGLNSIFRLLLVDAGMETSPFAPIPDRRHVARHQRPFTEEEFIKIYNAAPEPWKSASLIAWFTGLREESVFNLKWSSIKGDVLTTMPGKTARFGRAVQIPIHPQLQEHLASLPRKNELVLGAFTFFPKSSSFKKAFGEILEKAGIRQTGKEILQFNSFRDSFVTRCDVAGVPRHAVRGVVGHRSDAMTDLYSHDLTTARRIQTLPGVKLDESSKTGEI